MQYTSQNAHFSRCKSYRYSLRRSWNEGSGKAVFIGLNPSALDQHEDNPTLRRCAGFAQAWGCNSMEIVNLFAFCATKPAELKRSSQPVGLHNNRWIAAALDGATFSIACWGNHGEFMNRAQEVGSRHPELLCLGVNASGQPKHPLYIRATQTPFALPSLAVQ